MHDLKFKEAWWHFKPPVSLEKIKNPRIGEVASNFNENIKWVHRMVTALPYFASRLELQVRALMMAKFTYERPLYIFDGEFIKDPELAQTIIEDAKGIVRRFDDSGQGNFPERNLQLYQAGGDRFFAAFEDDKMADLPEAAHSIMLGMIVLAWTAVEVAIEDLHKAAVAESKQAASLAGDELRLSRMHFTLRKVTPKTKIDARTKKGRENFRSLRAVREAYSRSFDSDSSIIDRQISSLHLDALALV